MIKKIMLMLLFICSIGYGTELKNYNPYLNQLVEKIENVFKNNDGFEFKEFCYKTSEQKCFKVSYINAENESIIIDEIISKNNKNLNNKVINNIFILEDIKTFNNMIMLPSHTHSYFNLRSNGNIAINDKNYNEYEGNIIILLNKYYDFLNENLKFNKFNNSLNDLKKIK